MPPRQKVSVSIDSSLLEFVDTISSNRSEIFNEALAEWRKQKILNEIGKGYAKTKEVDPMIAEENLLLNDLALEAEGVDSAA